ncbi:aldehyde dehydrogenase family protein [Aeromicrobium phragmitis]|uniref:L-glutamate gamma-semialdehyde dehydrogenase n=2 Tax=Aeromicrobium phragmitis TaxID=2478914 RepID=A0A3L8PQ33_9ACTN|nr:aldehyde dehydrogenase family protein [Aeromicrobium phragmitis]
MFNAHHDRRLGQELTMTEPTVNYASSSLGDDALEAAFEQALRTIRAERPAPQPLVIGGEELFTGDVVVREDPCHAGVVIGAAHVATDDDVTRAVAAAKTAAGPWRRTPYAERVAMLRAAREDIAQEIAYLSAVVSAETGKTRLEAVGETTEVLDMIAHYCDLMVENDGYCAPLKPSGGDTNFDVMVPYGAFAVISPFNFPVALSIGMMVAALVTGNSVVLKPSDKTPRSTAEIAGMLRRHLPAGVLNVVSGGAEVGQALAKSDVDGIAFTGSAHVGWELVATRSPSGLPRPVLAEMGGQNPAVVAASADLDAAAQGIVRSAFGLSGQKCSACRRVVVDRRVADDLIAALVRETEKLVVGDPLDPASNLGPVIDDSIAARIDDAIATAQQDGRVVTGGRIDRPGNFFAPIIVTDLPLGHRLTRDELFAPFLAVTAVDDFDAALAEANAVDYGLSAGVFSGEQAEIDRFLDEIQAGVIYVNRAAGATTGAWPGVQSFCGWKLSGSTGKGGLGLWYLPGFMKEQSRTFAGQQ